MKDNLLDLDSKNLKDDFERFIYHSHMGFTYLETLVENWNPNNEHYEKLDDLILEFLEYYTKNTNRPFPDSQIGDLKSIVEKDKTIFY